jgi:glutamyl-tRNA reductase
VDLARQIFSDLKGRSAVLIGAGDGRERALLLNNLGAKLEVVGRSADARIGWRARSAEPRARSTSFPRF